MGARLTWCTGAQVLQFVHGVAAQLAEAGDRPEVALQLFLAGAQCASEVARLELIAYEFFEQARPAALPCPSWLLAVHSWTSCGACSQTFVPIPEQPAVRNIT